MTDGGGALEPADGSEQRNAHDIDPVLRAAQVAQKDEAPDGSSKGDQFRRSRHGRRSMFSLAVWTGPFRLQSRTEFWNVVIASAVLLGLTGALLLISLVRFRAWLG